MSGTRQLNFNTLLITIVGAVVVAGIKKIDESATQLAKVSTSQEFIATQVNELRGQMKDMVLKSDFQQESGRISREMESIKVWSKGEINRLDQTIDGIRANAGAARQNQRWPGKTD